MVSDMVMIVSRNMYDNHKLESCHSHGMRTSNSMTFGEIFIFQDFSMTFHDSSFFHDFHDRGNPAGTGLLEVELRLVHVRVVRMNESDPGPGLKAKGSTARSRQSLNFVSSSVVTCVG